jgi:hypothetical protein
MTYRFGELYILSLFPILKDSRLFNYLKLKISAPLVELARLLDTEANDLMLSCILSFLTLNLKGSLFLS